MKILIVEDEKDLQTVMQQSLEKERFVVETASTFELASQKINDYDYDCIVLDIMLPGGSGLDLLAQLKKIHKNDSVIIVSAKNSIEDKVHGLELGADDYLAKPFHLAELNARVKSIIRRKQNGGELKIEVGNITITPDSHKVYVDGVELNLTRKEFDMLYYFMSNVNRVISRTSLAETVWGDYIDQSDSFDFIYSQIKNLRKKLNAAGANAIPKAVYGFGYKMNIE